MKIPVIPSGLNVFVNAGRFSIAIPPDSKPVAICGGRSGT
jgi:hypothetical protein